MNTQTKTQQSQSTLTRAIGEKSSMSAGHSQEALLAPSSPSMKRTSFARASKDVISPETKTLLYLGIALVSGSKISIEAIMIQAQLQNIAKDKILEVVKIAKYAEAARVIGNTEIVLEHLKNR